MRLKLLAALFSVALILSACGGDSPETTETNEGVIPVEETTEVAPETEEAASNETLETFGNDTIGYFDLPAGSTEEEREHMTVYDVEGYPFSYIVTTMDDTGYFPLEDAYGVSLSTLEDMDATNIESSFFEVDGAKGFYIKSDAFNQTTYSFEIRNPNSQKTIRIERQSMGISMGEQKEKEGDFLLESYRLSKDSQEPLTFLEELPVVLGTKEEGELTLPEGFTFDSEHYAAVKTGDASSYIQPQLMSLEGDFDSYLSQYEAFAQENNITILNSDRVQVKGKEMLLIEGQFEAGEYYRYYTYPAGDYYMNWHIISPDENFINTWSSYFEGHITLP